MSPFDDAPVIFVSAALVLLGSGGLLLFGPRNVHRKIERGEMSEEEGETALRNQPKVAYLAMTMAIALVFVELCDKGLFGYSKLLALVPATISVGVVVFWLRHRRS